MLQERALIKDKNEAKVIVFLLRVELFTGSGSF